MSKHPTEGGLQKFLELPGVQTVLLPVTCKECGHTVKKTIGWLTGKSGMKCVGCGGDIRLYFDKDAIAAADELTKMVEDLKKKNT